MTKSKINFINVFLWLHVRDLIFLLTSKAEQNHRFPWSLLLLGMQKDFQKNIRKTRDMIDSAFPLRLWCLSQIHSSSTSSVCFSSPSCFLPVLSSRTVNHVSIVLQFPLGFIPCHWEDFYPRLRRITPHIYGQMSKWPMCFLSR